MTAEQKTADRAAAGSGARKGGRPAAGTDPGKRSQILEGAGRVFSQLGFDATSMSDVAREAQVSKATLYVYFEDKEHLFTAICAEKRDRNISEMLALLDTTGPWDETLTRLATERLRKITQPNVIAAHRIVTGLSERMPDIGREFFEGGPMRFVRALAKFLDHHVAAGALSIDDTTLAAIQFIELSQASVFRPRLYALTAAEPTDEEIDRVVASAVRVFRAAYAARP